MSYLKKIDRHAPATTDFPGGVGEGANIRTPCGPRRVELVRPGDLIVTRDNGLQPVRLIWQREIKPADIAAGLSAAPICLCPRAVGPMMPQNKIYLAPDHRVLVPGYRLLGQDETTCCLVQAQELAKSSDAAYTDSTAMVTQFYAFIFDTHQVFCCNGLPVESFLAGAKEISKLRESHRHDIVNLFPRLQSEPNAYPPIEYKPLMNAEFVA